MLKTQQRSDELGPSAGGTILKTSAGDAPITLVDKASGNAVAEVHKEFAGIDQRSTQSNVEVLDASTANHQVTALDAGVAHDADVHVLALATGEVHLGHIHSKALGGSDGGCKRSSTGASNRDGLCSKRSAHAKGEGETAFNVIAIVLHAQARLIGNGLYPRTSLCAIAKVLAGIIAHTSRVLRIGQLHGDFDGGRFANSEGHGDGHSEKCHIGSVILNNRNGVVGRAHSDVAETRVGHSHRVGEREVVVSVAIDCRTSSKTYTVDGQAIVLNLGATRHFEVVDNHLATGNAQTLAIEAAHRDGEPILLAQLGANASLIDHGVAVGP